MYHPLDKGIIAVYLPAIARVECTVRSDFLSSEVIRPSRSRGKEQIFAKTRARSGVQAAIHGYTSVNGAQQAELLTPVCDDAQAQDLLAIQIRRAAGNMRITPPDLIDYRPSEVAHHVHSIALRSFG